MLSLLFIFFAVAVVFSFLCSAWEAVLLSVTPAYIQRLTQAGHPAGKQLKAFKRDIDRPLAAILTLNTIAHTVGAIGVGNQAALVFSQANPLITNLLIPAAMTLGILILSEIIPKTLGAVYWRELAPLTVKCLVWVIRLFAPLIWMSEKITGLIKRGNPHRMLTRRDFLALTELGFDQGALDANESRMIRNLLNFESLRAEDVMTPRVVIHSANAASSCAEYHAQHRPLRFSRVPIHTGEPDKIQGYVLKSDVQAALLEQQGDTPLSAYRRDMLSFLGSTPIGVVFDRLLGGSDHIALVIDEYGGVEGIITQEDVIETLLGLDITDESDSTVNMRELARALWARRARALGLVVEAPSEPKAPD